MTMDDLLAGYNSAPAADKPAWLQRMNERVAAIQADPSVGRLRRMVWTQDGVTMVAEADGTVHQLAEDDPLMTQIRAGREAQSEADAIRVAMYSDLGTFIGVLGAFEDADIDVRDSYWANDDRPFVIMVDGIERRFGSVAVVDDRIVVVVA